MDYDLKQEAMADVISRYKLEVFFAGSGISDIEASDFEQRMVHELALIHQGDGKLFEISKALMNKLLYDK